jgi:hypothetical protein
MPKNLTNHTNEKKKDNISNKEHPNQIFHKQNKRHIHVHKREYLL